MKKSIESLVEKLQENAGGFLKGGFGSIRGGSVNKKKATNHSSCSNANNCSGDTNSGVCSNTGNCDGSSNPFTCQNSGGCAPAN